MWYVRFHNKRLWHIYYYNCQETIVVLVDIYLYNNNYNITIVRRQSLFWLTYIYITIIIILQLPGDDGVYGLTYNDDSVFSTKDRDNTSSISGNKCSEEAHSGWWFKKCTNVNLNGLWSPGDAGTGGKLVYWYSFKILEGLANTTLKIRRK